MNSDSRFVFDTNIIVCALLFADSTAGTAFTYALDHGTVLFGEALAAELHDVLGRAKFEKYFTRQERERLLESLIRESQIIEITESITVCRDPKTITSSNWRRVEMRIIS